MRILLMGNPNVGKSVVFNRLTGVSVISSNYPGTTVEYTGGTTTIGGETAEVVDVPGTYTLDPTCKAEEVARRLLDEGEAQAAAAGERLVVVNVVDATNLERSLNLTLQLLRRGLPTVVCLNLWDETRHTGVHIDLAALEGILGVACLPTTAVTGEGIKSLAEAIGAARVPDFSYAAGERWQEVGRIVDKVQTLEHKHHTLLERLGDATVRPLTALPFAAAVCFLAFMVIRLIGESWITYISDPFFDHVYGIPMNALSSALGGEGWLHQLLIGTLIDGEIDWFQSFGLLTTGLYIPLGAVLPYVFAFYLALSILEDTGYLPRLAVLMDTVMHRMGMHGMSIVPIMLGLGCNVPGALATRILETRRERFIAATVMSITVPCMAQMAMIAGLVGSLGVGYWGGVAIFVAIFLTLFCTALVLGLVFNRLIKGESTELLVDIPPYRVPYFKGLVKKLWMRLVWFVKEAVPWVVFGVFLVQVLEWCGLIGFAGRVGAPVVEHVLGLPREAVGGLVVGFLRKDMAVGMLTRLGMEWRQVAVASVVLTMYFPCVATFSVLLKEFGVKDMCKSAAIMVGTALTAGALLNLVLGVF